MTYLQQPYTDPATRAEFAQIAAQIEGAHVDYARGLADIEVVAYANTTAMLGDPTTTPPTPKAGALASWRLELTPDEIATMRDGFATLCYQILLARPQFASATLVNPA